MGAAILTDQYVEQPEKGRTEGRLRPPFALEAFPEEVTVETSETFSMERDDAHPSRTRPAATKAKVSSSEDLLTPTGQPVGPNSPSEVLTGQRVELAKSPAVLSTKNKTCWVVHSGHGHGDVRLLREYDYHVLHHERWFDYGDAHNTKTTIAPTPQAGQAGLVAHLHSTGPKERAA